MTSVTLVAIVLTMWLALRDPARPWPLASWRPKPALARAACGLLAASFAVQVLLPYEQVRSEHFGSFARWQRALPIPIYDGRSGIPHDNGLLSIVAIAVALVQVAMLAVIARSFALGEPGRGTRLAACAAVAAIAACALCTPAISTTDPYEYAAAGMLGLAAYSPPPGIFDGTAYAPIAANIPMKGVIYGPLWLLCTTAVTSFIPSILGKLLAMRALHAVLIFLSVAALRAARAPASSIAAFALNPFLWYCDVANGHADIYGLALLAGGAAAVARKNAALTALAIAAAGSVKIVFLLFGFSLLAGIDSLRTRIVVAAVASAGVMLAALAVPHDAYLRAIFSYQGRYEDIGSQAVSHLWVLSSLVAIAAVFALALARRAFPLASFAFGQFAPASAPWYLVWGMPYAFASGGSAAFLVALPVAGLMIDPFFDVTPLPELVFGGALFLLATEALRRVHAMRAGGASMP